MSNNIENNINQKLDQIESGYSNIIDISIDNNISDYAYRKLDDKIKSVNMQLASHASPGIFGWLKDKIFTFFSNWIENMGGWQGILETIGEALLSGVGKSLAKIIEGRLSKLSDVISKYTKGWVDLSSFFNQTMSSALESIDGLIEQNQTMLSNLTKSFTTALSDEFNSQAMIWSHMPGNQAIAFGTLMESQEAAMTEKVEDMFDRLVD